MLVRGWLLSEFFELQEISPFDEEHGTRIFINGLNETAGGYLPSPLVGDIAGLNSNHLLPCVLQSIGRAFDESNRTRSVQPLEAYGILCELGRSHEQAIHNWITSGVRPSGSTVVGTPALRQEFLLDQIHEKMRQWAQIENGDVAARNWWVRAWCLELKTLVQDCLVGLARTIT